jgi:2-phospho-L-lactate guanylyltransferase
MSVALVPVKSLSAGKSRFLSQLSRERVEVLCVAMLEDVLSALLAAPSLRRVVVATPDDRGAAAAERIGAEALHGPDAGLNAAIDAGPDKLGLSDGEPYLVVLGDVAGAQAEDIELLFASLGEIRGAPPSPAAVLARSSDGGTSALLRAPFDAIPSCFGPQSAARHADAADAAGVPLRQLELPSLELDLDDAGDVERFLTTPGGGERTRKVLGELGWTADSGGPGQEK